MVAPMKRAGERELRRRRTPLAIPRSVESLCFNGMEAQLCEMEIGSELLFRLEISLAY